MSLNIRILIVIHFVFSTVVFAQTKGDYIVTSNNDTVSISPLKWNNTRIVCKDAKGIKTKYKAKDILAYSLDSIVGETGIICPTIIGFKKWMFLDREVKGNVSLYTVTGTETSLHSKQPSAPGDRYVVYTHTHSSLMVWYFRKEGEPKGKYHKLKGFSKLEKFLSDCPSFVEKLNSKNPVWDAGRIDLVEYYNANCK